MMIALIIMIALMVMIAMMIENDTDANQGKTGEGVTRRVMSGRSWKTTNSFTRF